MLEVGHVDGEAGFCLTRSIVVETSVVTVLDKDLKRQVTVDGVAYTVALNADGFRLTGKGKRKPEVELLWRDLLSEMRPWRRL